MKSLRNEQGSLPFVILVVFMIAMSISSLTSLLLTETLNIRFSIDKDIHQIYTKDTMMELTKNITDQFILSREWTQTDNQTAIITPYELVELETLLNQELLPVLTIQGTIHLLASQTDFNVEDYCHGTTAEDVTTFDCLDEPWILTLQIELKTESESTTEELIVGNYQFSTNETKTKILTQRVIR